MWAAVGVRAATVRVQVRRADGRVEDLGVVSRFERTCVRGSWSVARRWWEGVAAGGRTLLIGLNSGWRELAALLGLRRVRGGWAKGDTALLRRTRPWRSGAGKER